MNAAAAEISCDLGGIEGGKHLDQVEAHEIEVPDAAGKLEPFVACETAHLDRPGAGGIGRIKEIDVESEMGFLVPDRFQDFCGRPIDPVLMQIVGGDDCEAEIL